MKNIFESEFKLRDEVCLNLDHPVNAYVTAVKFYKDGDITYDLNVQKGGGLITFQDVHFACIVERPGNTVAEVLCNPKPETPMNKIHWMIHEACYAISHGNTDEAQKILAKADKLSHDHC